MYIKVEVVPGASEEVVEKNGLDSYKMLIKQKPERNMVNKRVIEILRGQFSGSRVVIKLVSGHTSQSKIFSVDVIN